MKPIKYQPLSDYEKLVIAYKKLQAQMEEMMTDYEERIMALEQVIADLKQ